MRSRKLPKPGKATKVATVIALIIITIGYFIWIDNKPRIEIVSGSTAPSLLQANSIYENAIDEILSQSPLHRLKLTIDTTSIERKLKQRFPEIAEVAVVMPLTSRRLLYKIQPATPALALSDKQGENYIVDTRGVAVAKADKVNKIQEFKLPLVTDESGLEIKTGRAVLTQDSLTFITSVIDQLKAQNISYSTLTLPTVANELHLGLAGEGYFVKFNTVGDPRLQAGALVAVKKQLQSTGKKPAEYIDVRLHDKAFYK